MSQMSQRDFYEVLGVPRDASADEVRKAYLKLAHKYHPDKTGGDEEAETQLKEINEAYDILKNKEKRAKYDQYGHMGEQMGAGGFGGFGGGGEAPFDDFFDTLFGRGGGGGGGRGRRGAQPGHDLEYRVAISLREAAKGVNKTVKFKRQEVCGDCNGSGAAAGTKPVSCPDCGGVGQVRRSQGFFSITQTCPRCQGAGSSIESPCSKCSGRGRVRSDRELSFDLPAGVDTGSRLRLSGEGEPGDQGGPRGDLYVLVEVQLDEIFDRDGNHILCEVPISITQAMLGDTIRVPTLEGEADIKVPPGTQPGTSFRLRGMGIKDLRGYHTGDQMVTVQVEIPTRLNGEQKKLVKEFKEISNEKHYPIYHRFMEKVKKSLGG